MVSRIVSVGFAFLAVCLMVNSASAAAKAKPQRGTVVSVSGKQMVVNIKAKGDATGMDKTLDLSDNLSVTVDGNPGKIEDVKAGDKVSITVGDDGKVTTIKKGKKAA